MLEYERFLANLARAQIEFAVVGGFAVGLNGFVRVTEDVDILVEDSPQNLQRLIDFFKTYGEGCGGDLTVADFDEEEGCIRVIEEFPVDVFTKISGKKLDDFKLCRTQIEDQEILYLSAEALIELKQNSWRDKDKMDAAELKRILNR